MRRLVSMLSVALVLATALAAPPMTLPAAASAGAPSAASSGAPAPVIGRDPSAATIIVVDTSGSMADAESTGRAKIDVAEQAMLRILDSASSSSRYGVVTYPGGGESPSSAGCDEGVVRLPLDRIDIEQAHQKVRDLPTNGNTPTSAALRQAAQLLSDSGFSYGTIVLVSDGLANCGPPPCETAKALVAGGLNVKIHTISYDMKEEQGAADLACVARETGGTTYKADQAQELVDAMAKAAQPTLELDVSMPGSLVPTVGSARTLATTAARAGTPVRATVHNAGTSTAKDVRVSLDLVPDGRADAQAVVVPVNPPLRYLGNLAPDGRREVEFVVRPEAGTGTLRWRATAVATAGRPARKEGTVGVDDRLAPAALGPVLRDAKKVVIVGDSYSSGEGAEKYQEGTYGPGAPNWCHRSTTTYGHAIWGDATTVVACSGAVSANLKAPQSSGLGDGQVEAQLSALARVVADEKPDAVLLSFGGNDVGFGSMVKKCILSERCGNDEVDDGDGTAAGPVSGANLGQGRLARAAQVRESLVSAYEQIDATVNSEGAVRDRGGRAAPVVVLPYVRIIPAGRDKGTQTAGCFAFIDDAESAFLNEFIDTLNESVRAAVERARTSGGGDRPLYVVDDVVDAFQPGNTICADTVSNAVKVDSDDALALAVKALPHVFSLLVRIQAAIKGNVVVVPGLLRDLWRDGNACAEFMQQLLHPKPVGHTAEARALVAWSQQARVAKPPSASPTASPWPSGFPRLPGLLLASVARTLRAPTGAGDLVYVDRTGFAPHGDVAVWVESSPRVAGGGHADDTGRFRGWVLIPPQVAPGDHTLVVEGLTDTARLRALRTPLHVERPGAATAYLLGLAGIALTLAGASTALLAWRRARRAVSP